MLMKSRKLALLLVLPAAIWATLAGQAAYGSDVPKLVFAHFMVCCDAAGGSPTVETYMSEIQYAQAHGVDGFALNCGGWSKSEPQYKLHASMMYEAAARLKSGFQLFISADGKARDEMDDMVDSLGNHPNQLHVNGRPVLSTFGGGPQGRQLIDTAHRKGAFFVPFFYPPANLVSRGTSSERPGFTETEGLAQLYPDVDGFFFFGAAGSSEELAASNQAHAKTWRGRGRVFMASVTPFYLGYGANFRVFDTRGFQGMAHEWETAINSDANWVEIVTWNDWGESTYLSPTPKTGPLAPLLLPHTAYLDASRYYIDWFKSGRPPAIDRDKIFYFYRLQPASVPVPTMPANAPSPSAKPANSQVLQDKVYVTAFLKSPARLTIVSGGRQATFDLHGGVNQVETPFFQGAQQFILSRQGQTLIDKQGERAISAADPTSRDNYFSGEAEN